MSTTKSRRVPKLQRHKATGKARVRISGRDFYCGDWGSPEAEDTYRRLVGEYMLTGRPPAMRGRSNAISVNELLVAFLEFAEQHYQKNGRTTDELHCLKSAMRPLKALYGSAAVDEFGPLALKVVREQMVDCEWTRSFINASVRRIRRIFRWGVENEMVPSHVLAALEAVAGLKAGRTAAPDRPARMPVPQEHIDAVRKIVRQRTRDLIDLQLATGARPGEILSLTTAMIDRSRETWIARLNDHKTAHLGRERTLPFGPKAQVILRRYLDEEDPENRLFPIRRASYGHTVRNACLRAEVPVWTPHWLRHTVATRLREECGIEAAQVMLGHSRIEMTQAYAHATLQAAIDLAQRIG